MTHKDFNLITQAIASMVTDVNENNVETISKTEVVNRFLLVLATTSPNFDRSRFIAACYGR